MKTWLACLALYFSESWRDSAINFPFPRAEFVFRTKKKLGPPPPPVIKLSSPYSSRLLSGRHGYRALYFRDTQRARNSTRAVCWPRERDPPPPLPSPPPFLRGIIGLRSALSQLSHRRKRTARLIIPKPFLYHYADSPYRLPPSSCSFSITLLGTRTVGKRGEGMGDGRLQKRELERRSTKRGRNGGEGGEGEGGPPFIPETELPVRSHSTNLGS